MPMVAVFMLVRSFLFSVAFEGNAHCDRSPPTVQWDTSGISIYFFPAGTTPADIEAGVPHPETWGAAQARWPASACDPFKYFKDHSAIFDTTFWYVIFAELGNDQDTNTSLQSGDWAGAVWGVSGIPGQEQSCAQRTGVATCEEYVRNNGATFAEACASLLLCSYSTCCADCIAVDWEVRSVKIYQLQN